MILIATYIYTLALYVSRLSINVLQANLSLIDVSILRFMYLFCMGYVHRSLFFNLKTYMLLYYTAFILQAFGFLLVIQLVEIVGYLTLIKCLQSVMLLIARFILTVSSKFHILLISLLI